MAHDPCIVCGDYDGLEIQLSGADVAPVRVCSYDCLESYAKSKQEES